MRVVFSEHMGLYVHRANNWKPESRKLLPWRLVSQEGHTDVIAIDLKRQEEPVEQSKGQQSSEKCPLKPLFTWAGYGGGSWRGKETNHLSFPQFFAPRTALGTVRMLTLCEVSVWVPGAGYSMVLGIVSMIGSVGDAHMHQRWGWRERLWMPFWNSNPRSLWLPSGGSKSCETKTNSVSS